MGFADLAKDGGKGKGPAAAVSITVAPIDVHAAAAAMLKAVEAKDVDGIANAMRLGYTACEAEVEDDKSKEDDEDDSHDDADEG